MLQHGDLLLDTGCGTGTTGESDDQIWLGDEPHSPHGIVGAGGVEVLERRRCPLRAFGLEKRPDDGLARVGLVVMDARAHALMIADAAGASCGFLSRASADDAAIWVVMSRSAGTRGQFRLMTPRP